MASSALSIQTGARRDNSRSSRFSSKLNRRLSIPTTRAETRPLRRTPRNAITTVPALLPRPKEARRPRGFNTSTPSFIRIRRRLPSVTHTTGAFFLFRSPNFRAAPSGVNKRSAPHFKAMACFNFSGFVRYGELRRNSV